MANFTKNTVRASVFILIILGLSFFSANAVLPAAPIITNVNAINIMGSGAQITWNTDILSDSMVSYGTFNGAYNNHSIFRCDAGGMVTSHCVNLTGLSPSTIYYYIVKSADISGVHSASPEKTFTSASSGGSTDIMPPSIPTGFTAIAVSSTQVNLSWNASTDNVGVTGYKIYRNNVFLAFPTATSYSDTSVIAGTTYSYFVCAYDAATNSGCTNLLSVTTPTSITTNSAPPVASSTSDTISLSNPSAPTVTFFISQTYNSGNSAIFTVKFSESINISTINFDNIYLYPVDYPTYRVPGSLTIRADGFDFITQNLPNVDHVFVILKNVIDLANNTMASDYKSANLRVYSSCCPTYPYPPTNTSGNISTTTAVKTIKGKITYPDGRVVTNAGIEVYNSALGLWANGSVDSTGNYLLKVSGGTWQVGVYPNTTAGQISDWVYTQLPKEISFLNDTSLETIILDFTVGVTQASIKGSILKSDGMPPLSGTAGVSFKDSLGYEYKTHTDSSGSFFIYVSIGAYSVQVFSTDAQFGVPAASTLSVVQGEQKDLGKLYLTSNAEKIKGKVTNSSGVGVSNVWVNANNYLQNKFVQTITLSDGSYELIVSAGDWDIFVYPDPTVGYYYTQGSKKVIVSAGQIIEANFILSLLNSQISGSIVDSSGQILTDAYGGVAAGNFGGPIGQGVFSFNVPVGTHILNVYFPSDSKYSQPVSQIVTVLSGENKKINFVASTLTSAISGLFKDGSGNLVTGLGLDKIKVYVSAKSGAWYNAQVNSVLGSYNVNVSPGIWYLGYWVDPSSGYISSGANIEINILTGQTYKFDIILAKIDSSISGTTKSSEGKILANAWITVDNNGLGGSSDANGNFKIPVSAGTYLVRSYYSPTFGYINPSEIKVEALSGKIATVDLIFKKPEVKTTGSTIINNVKYPVFVWAWGELGGYAEARSDSSGLYSLSISKNNKWHLSASSELDGIFYKSSDVLLDTTNQDLISQDLVLLKVSTVSATVEKIVQATQPQSLTLTDGAKVILPANSLDTAGDVNVTLKPVVETPSFGSTSLVGTSYEVEAKDNMGQTISNLNSEVTITIPYKEDDLTAKGLKPEDLSLSFFDETSFSWRPLEKQVIDKENKVVSGVVNHLTRFALVAPADTTPPSSPSSIKALILTDKTIKLTWVNPKLDFSNIKIYRSGKLGELGDLVYNNVTTESQVDNNVVAGKTYYYTVRAIDLAGNESVNVAQVNAFSGVATVFSKFTKKLSRGSSDEQVKKLQEFLAKDKTIYPEGLTTGYFGALTEAAVKKFQTKYGIESIGLVGPKTRVKLNELLSQ